MTTTNPLGCIHTFNYCTRTKTLPCGCRCSGCEFYTRQSAAELRSIDTAPHSHVDRQNCYVIDCTRLIGEFTAMARTTNVEPVQTTKLSDLAIGILVAALAKFDHEPNWSTSSTALITETHIQLMDMLVKADSVTIRHR